MLCTISSRHLAESVSGHARVCPERLTLCQFQRFVLIRFTSDRDETPCKAEIANLQLAVRIDQKVSGLQVSVDHVRRVDVLQTCQSGTMVSMRGLTHLHTPQ